MKIWRVRLIFLICYFGMTILTYAEGPVAQTLTIYTHFKSIVGKPTWLLELRDVESGEVHPFLFDITHKDNFWVAFSKEHTYRVTASVLKFPPYVTINNFCYLQNGILTGKSMYITLTGTIAPDLRRTKCHVIKYSQ